MRQSDIFGAGSVLDSLRLNAHDVVLDLGCGDARWLVAAAARGCAGRGVDLNEDLLQKGHEAAAEAGVSSLVQLENKDMFDASLAGSTVIIVYLFRERTPGLYQHAAETEN
eukprot:jgi/Undpi1/9159/HiC_scaffold_26.g11617.m1